MDFAEAEKWVKKALHAWEVANVLADYRKENELLYRETSSKLTSPVTQIYYSAFYCATALLGLEGLRFKKHSAVKGEFGRIIVKQKKFPKKYGKFFNRMLELRKRSDYSPEALILTRTELKSLLARSNMFIKASNRYIQKKQRKTSCIK